jgi:hypothetical protein
MFFLFYIEKEENNLAPIDISTWFTALSNFGFPIVITVYLLHRFEKKLDNLTAAIDQLRDG